MKGSYQKEDFLSKLFQALPNLTSLMIRNDFTSRRSSSSSDDHNDVNNVLKTEMSQMGKALQSTSSLCSLTLSNCGLDDDLIRLLLLALDDGVCCDRDGIRNTLVHLDLVGFKNLME